MRDDSCCYRKSFALRRLILGKIELIRESDALDVEARSSAVLKKCVDCRELNTISYQSVNQYSSILKNSDADLTDLKEAGRELLT